MKALDTIQATLGARRRVGSWTQADQSAVWAEAPDDVRSSYSAPEWATLVELARRATEEPRMAAQRLALYVKAHQERYHVLPSMVSLLDGGS